MLHHRIVCTVIFLASLSLLAGQARADAPASQPAATQGDGGDSPRALREKMRDASLAGDVESYVRCFDPAIRDGLRKAKALEGEVPAKAAAVGKTVEDKLGKEGVEEYQKVIGKSMAMDPLRVAVDDGKVNWDRIKITVTGDAAAVEITGVRTDKWKLKRAAGRWYVDNDLMTPKMLEASIEGKKKGNAKGIKFLEDFEAKVKAGTVTKENLKEELKKSWETQYRPPAEGGPKN